MLHVSAFLVRPPQHYGEEGTVRITYLRNPPSTNCQKPISHLSFPPSKWSCLSHHPTPAPHSNPPLGAQFVFFSAVVTACQNSLPQASLFPRKDVSSAMPRGAIESMEGAHLDGMVTSTPAVASVRAIVEAHAAHAAHAAHVVDPFLIVRNPLFISPPPSPPSPLSPPSLPASLSLLFPTSPLLIKSTFC